MTNADHTPPPRPRKVVAVVNPTANQGKAEQLWNKLEPTCTAHFSEFETFVTRMEGHGRELAAQALADGADLVIAVGGDGTVNEVLNGFVDERGDLTHPSAVLGVVAAGSGSDFQRMFAKLPSHGRLHAFLASAPHRVDYGLASFQSIHGEAAQRAFLNIASAGISGDVLHHLKSSSSEGSAQMRYLRATLRSIVSQRNIPTKVTVNDDPETTRRFNLTLACAANGRYFGSGMKISPDSEIDDGQLRLLTASVPTRVRLLALLARVYSAKHLHDRGVRYQGAQKIELAPIDPSREIRLELDGEAVGTLPASFSIRSRALWVQAPGLGAKP